MPYLPPADLIAGPAIVVTQDARRSVLRDAWVAATAGAITYVGPASGLPQLAPGGTQLDATGQFVVPGFIDTHTHLYQTLMKGLGDDMGLMLWLERLTMPTIPHLTDECCYHGAAVGLTEAIRSGTTTVLDYFVATDQPSWLGEIARAYRDTGVRGVLAQGLADNMTRRTVTPLEEQLASLRRLRAEYDGPTFNMMLGPGSVWSMTPEGLKRVRAEADATGMGITLHLNEATFDNAENLTRYGENTVDMLDRLGFLGPDVVLAHCCYFTDRDIELVSAAGATVATNPVSNMYLGNQFARIPEMLAAGVGVSLGADGAASNNTQDMFEALKMCALVQKGHHADPAKMTAQHALDIATLGGARSLCRDDIGAIEVGKCADFFLFDPRHVRSGPWHDPVSTIVYSGGEMNVTATVVEGRVLMEGGVLKTVDESALVANAQAVADALRERAGTATLLEGRPWARTEVFA